MCTRSPPNPQEEALAMSYNPRTWGADKWGAQRVPKSRHIESHREEVRLRQGTDHSEASHWSPWGPCLDPPQELDSAAFPPSTDWGRYWAEKRLSQGQRWSLSSHPSSAASDSPRLWDGRRLAHRPVDRHGLGPPASKDGSGHSAVSHLRTHSREAFAQA